jgi:cell division protein ZapA
MSESLWKSEVVEEAEPERAAETGLSRSLPRSRQRNQAPLALSVDEFSALEERVLRAVNLVKRERQARAEAEERASNGGSQTERAGAAGRESAEGSERALRRARRCAEARGAAAGATGCAGTVRPGLNQEESGNARAYVTVEIYDQTYHLSGQEPEHIRRLAELVDARMRAVAAQGHTVDSLRVAVLAALNLADELSRATEASGADAQLGHARAAA